MKKMYVNKNELNDYELKNGYVSYKRLINRYCSNKVLCNNIAQSEVFNEEFYNELYNSLDYLNEDELKEYEDDPLAYYEGLEVYQYFITDMSEYEAETLKELNNELIVYSSDLDCYILCVCHYGTSWDYVLTDVKWTTDWSEC
jgi:hypothetical protein